MELPIDIGSMTLAQAKEYCSKRAHEHGYPCEKTECELRRRHICVGWVHEWDFERLTPQELEICRAVGAKWITKGEKARKVDFWNATPMKRTDEDGKIYYVACGVDPFGSLHDNLFPSIKPGDRICIEDLIKEADDGLETT